MAEYAKRTCKLCGKKVPANELVTIQVNRQGGARSKAGVSGMTFVGALAGNKASSRAIKRWFFNSSQRNYKLNGKKVIQVCKACSRSGKTVGNSSGGSSKKRIGCGGIFLGFFVLNLLIALIFLPIASCQEKKSEKVGSNLAVNITEVLVMPDKDLVRVSYDIKNSSEKRIKASLHFFAKKRTEEVEAASSSIDLVIPAQSALEHENIVFALSRLKERGIEDPTDGDICKISWRITSASDE